MKEEVGQLDKLSLDKWEECRTVRVSGSRDLPIWWRGHWLLWLFTHRIWCRSVPMWGCMTPSWLELICPYMTVVIVCLGVLAGALRISHWTISVWPSSSPSSASIIWLRSTSSLIWWVWLRLSFSRVSLTSPSWPSSQPWMSNLSLDNTTLIYL